jgi:tripartite-type tricarboxylate transporter receptor subunit TctC
MNSLLRWWIWCACACVARGALAQAWPAKPVRLVLGFPAGTNVDILARPIAQRMGEQFGQQVIVDNRPGATGLKGYDITGWHGVFAPAGTPREIVERVNAAIAKILGTQEIRDLWASQGMAAVTTTPEQFASRIRADYDKYGRIVKAVGIQPE